MCFINDAICTFYKETRPAARKLHRCAECRYTIKPGQHYHLVKAIWEGVWTTLRTCLPCEALRLEIHDWEKTHGCREYESWPPYEGLSEALRENRGQYTGANYGRLRGRVSFYRRQRLAWTA